jgi:hypothetical protein
VDEEKVVKKEDLLKVEDIDEKPSDLDIGDMDNSDNADDDVADEWGNVQADFDAEADLEDMCWYLSCRAKTV